MNLRLKVCGLLTVAVLLSCQGFAADIPGTIVAAKITTGNTANTFSIGDTGEMAGTPKQVADITTRDAIPAARRVEGMTCWVISESAEYRLVGGIANANWTIALYMTNVVTLYATNTYIEFITNSWMVSTNLYATNVYVNFFTNNYAFITNIYATNVYVNFFTNNYAFITNLYATNTYIEYLTNNYLYTTNLYATNVYVNFFTNNYAFITNLYATNTYIEYLTNNYLYTTNLYATNVYIEYLTNNYAFITNLYATNVYINYLTNSYTFTTNLYATNVYINYLTNNYLFTTNLYVTNNYVNFLTNNYMYVTNLYVEHITGIKGYIVLASPFSCDGTGTKIYTNDNTKTYFGQAQFSNSADEAANYCTYFITVPEDLDTDIDLKVERFKFQLGGADTGTHRYIISMDSVADSAAYAGSLGDPIILDFAGDASGASGDVETISAVTLTGWKAAMTAGQLFVIRVARDGNAGEDASTVDSYSGPIVISYGVQQ